MDITIGKVILTQEQASSIHLVKKSYLNGIKFSEDEVVLNAKRELTPEEIQEVKDALSSIVLEVKKDTSENLKKAKDFDELKTALLEYLGIK